MLFNCSHVGNTWTFLVKKLSHFQLTPLHFENICIKFFSVFLSELKSQCVNYLQEKVETNDPHLMALWDEVKKRPNCQDLMVVISAKAALSFQHIFKEKKFLNLDVDELVMLLSSDDIVIERLVCH